MGVYNSISHIQRIAFIDGLTDARAEELSNNYPFAICYADDGNGMQNYIPGFWKQGKRYGIKAVDTTPINIPELGIELALQLENNILKLYSGSIINHIKLSYPDEIPDDGVEIYNVDNKLTLEFGFYKDEAETDIISNNFPVLKIYDGDNDNDTANYLSYINVKRSAVNGASYDLIVDNNYEGIYPLKFIHNHLIDPVIVKVKPYKFPQDITWENNIITIDNSSNNSQYIDITFTIDNDYHIDPSRFTLNKNNFTIKNESSLLVSNDIISNISFYETREGRITINCEGLKDSYTITTIFTDDHGGQKPCSSILKLIFEQKFAEGDLYYIGNYDSLQINNNEILVQNNLVNPNKKETGWHYINENYYDYEQNPFEVSYPYDCVIIPDEYSLKLPLFEEEALKTRRLDNWWDNKEQESKLIVNNKSYKIYKLNTESYMFINSIEQS